MKNLLDLTGVKILTTKDQKDITGGRGPNAPCGETGGQIISTSEQGCHQWGLFWTGSSCWACY